MNRPKENYHKVHLKRKEEESSIKFDGDKVSISLLHTFPSWLSIKPTVPSLMVNKTIRFHSCAPFIHVKFNKRCLEMHLRIKHHLDQDVSQWQDLRYVQLFLLSNEILNELKYIYYLRMDSSGILQLFVFNKNQWNCRL